MKQHEAVIQTLREHGGYATLGYLNQHALKISDCHWGTKTPFASIRRIVQEHPAIFKIKPGLWGLVEYQDAILQKFSLDSKAEPAKQEEFNHTYYQGLLVEIGNHRGFATWIPNQDKNRVFLDKRLADIATLSQFPPFTYGHVLDRARTIDVIWFNTRNFPEACFEVEHSTDIQNSLLKFVELQDFRTKLNIVADTVRQKEFETKLNYSGFTSIQESVRFVDYESLSSLHAKVSELSTITKAIGI